MDVEGKKVYIAGKMRGIPLYNFPAFDAAAERIRGLGGIPFSPADMDRAAGFNPEELPEDHNWDQVEGFDMEAAFDRDVAAIKAADAIYMLASWEQSKNAKVELGMAEWLGKEVLYESTWRTDSLEEDVLDEARRITGGDRNVQYGDPNIDFKRTSTMWTGFLMSILKDGCRLTPKMVAWMMVLLKASREQHQCKRDNYVDAIGYLRCGARCEGLDEW